MSSADARRFFLKPTSYFTLRLPPYFDFETVLSDTSQAMSQQQIQNTWRNNARRIDGVNHTFMTNKDGKYAWRPLQLIHPALYVSLVNHLTTQQNWTNVISRFSDFQSDPRVECSSIPVESLVNSRDQKEQIIAWWNDFEQRSFELSLDFSYVLNSDVTDCYSSIYTHSIPWAIHTRTAAKADRRRHSLMGNEIDAAIQDMRQGQTNGIPQGSILMDFIAELVLGYADKLLISEISRRGISDFHILRYRDDYRIFVNNVQEGELILRVLAEVLASLSLTLKPEKTIASDDIISASLKDDKLDWITRRQGDGNLQRHLIIIYNHAVENPNSGSVERALVEWSRRLRKVDRIRNPLPLIGIVTEIAMHNPRVYGVVAAILSLIFSHLPDDIDKREVIAKIETKFRRVPNSGHMQIWLQRICHPFALGMSFDETLCRLAYQENVTLWNSDWIPTGPLRSVIDAQDVILMDELANIPAIVPPDEVELFMLDSGLYW